MIVDDCSTDNTDEIVSKYDDDRIIYLKNKKILALLYQEIRHIKNARVSGLHFLDSDDLWYPG
ncbi:MAG: glycosyltransferase [Blautia wexlerae]